MRPEAETVAQLLRLALAEDLGGGDVTSVATIDPAARGEAAVRAKQELVVSGLRILAPLWELVDPQVQVDIRCADGDRLRRGDVLAVIRGSVRSLLAGERVCLNFLGHLCGVATQTATFVAQVGPHNAKIMDTRKTTPGLRVLEKQAVVHGGGHNHRMGLFDQILIKDNHLRACGGVTPAVQKARALRPDLKIEVEVTNESELREAIAAKADIVLLDNMDIPQVARCVQIAAGKVEVEVSGGITATMIRPLAEIGVDRISIGALTHSAPAADLHMKLTAIS